MLPEHDALRAERMAFTLELGKNWRPWQAYREFVCNAWDEGGDVDCLPRTPAPLAGKTRVIVECDALLEVFGASHEYFLPKAARPIATSPEVDVYPGESRGVFYRGVRVYDLEEPSMYTYNIKSTLTLSEDRTAPKFYVDWAIVQGLASMTSEALISRVIRAPEGRHERKLDFNWSSFEFGEAFLEIARSAVRSNSEDVIPSLAMRVRAMDKDKVRPEEIVLSRVEMSQLDKAVAFLRRRGINIDLEEVKCCESLGTLVLGAVIGGEIWVTREAFAQGSKIVAGTILEEWAHRRHGLQDESRGMQNWLINLAMSWGEQVDGEAL
jgi:hypothetical protein